MKFRPAIALLSLTLAVAACGELPFTTPQPEEPGHSGPPTVSPIDQPIQTSNEGVAISTAEASTMNTAMFRASGNEPFWAVTADGKTAVLERPGAKSVGISVNRLTYARGVEFVGVLNGRPFTLNVQAASCTDSMSGQKFPFTARVAANGQRMTGCAGPTEVMPKAQTRASTAAPAKRAAASAPAAPKPAPSTEAPKPETPKTDDAATAPITTTPATTPAAPVIHEPATTTPATPAPADATPSATPVTPPASESATPATDPAKPETPAAADETATQPPAAVAPILPEAEADAAPAE